MNLLDHIVVKVNSKPYKKYNHWFVDVESDCYGSIQKNSIMVNLYCEALKVKVGYIFYA